MRKKNQTVNAPKFIETFKDYVCEGDSIETEHKGITYRARLVYDQDYSLNDDDSHNVDQAITGCNEEHQARLLEARAAYERGDWNYFGVVLSAETPDGYIKDHLQSLWGIEGNYPGSDNGYFLTVANELLNEELATNPPCEEMTGNLIRDALTLGKEYLKEYRARKA